MRTGLKMIAVSRKLTGILIKKYPVTGSTSQDYSQNFV